jgi:8-oxo-dGTP pyrophosphatase MutT (NUDIX family)
MQQQYKSRQILFCINCSEAGHISKQCSKPIISYGCIAFQIRGWNQIDDILKGSDTIQQDIKYLMIQRRDSIGFVDFMRGKYKIGDNDYIIKQIEGMTRDERERLISKPFDALWDELWGLPQEGFHAYRAEREHARQKLEALRIATPSLAEIIESIPVIYLTPEWGFPKGRREMHESEYACALREFYEETNLSEADILPVRNLTPLSETFMGSNSIQYSHKYFMAYVRPESAVRVGMVSESVNPHMTREIGDIRWCSLEEAMSLIRPAHLEKQTVLKQADTILKTMFPVMIGSNV